MKIKKSWIIILVIVAIIIGFFVIKPLFKNPLDGYTAEKLSKGEIVQEVSETGSVKATESVNLSFKSIGRIARIDVSEGDTVRKGDILAELDMSQSAAQLQSAQAALGSSLRQYDKLLNGSTKEDIKIYEDAVTSAEHDLQSAKDNSLNTLNDAYNKIYNAYNVVVSMHNTYFTYQDQQGSIVLDSKNSIKEKMESAKTTDVSQMISILNGVYNDLSLIRNQCDVGNYYSTVTTTDKTSLDTQKGYINTASVSVLAAKQSINSYGIALQEAKDNLASKVANPRTEDVGIYQSEVNQARANVNLYQSQIGDAYLRSPIDGKITDINAKKGELASPSASIINLLSTEPFQVKVDIYEQDIVNVKPNDPVNITLVAFPKQTFVGKVLSINPGEKIIDNVVYYEVTVDFPSQPEGIRSGMTADIVILTNKLDSVLRIPKNTVENLDGKDMVQVVNKGKIEDREITIGLEGNDYYEILSGLNEGDEIITGKK